MKILFVHNNFPAQFKHLAPALVATGKYEVASFSLEQKAIPGITSYAYKPAQSSTQGIHPWVADFETKVIRGHACLNLAESLRKSGYTPDCIIAHPGWGEALFLKQVWPKAKLGMYCELYYNYAGYDYGFERNYENITEEEISRFRLKNLNNDLVMAEADAAISPTLWQASSYPKWFQDKITVVHDGIDTELLVPDASTTIRVRDITLSKADEVVTFVNRNLEPTRGYDQFMKALPMLLRERPNAKVLIVGGEGLSYGAPPPAGHTWKSFYISEIFPLLTEQQKSRIFFLGNLPYEKYLSVLRVSSAHVYLTYPFVLGWSMLEAMSLECCLIASDTGPVREVIEDGENGWLVSFNDPVELTKKIVFCLENRQLASQIGKSARRSICESYDLKRIVLPKQLSWIDNLITV